MRIIDIDDAFARAHAAAVTVRVLIAGDGCVVEVDRGVLRADDARAVLRVERAAAVHYEHGAVAQYDIAALSVSRRNLVEYERRRVGRMTFNDEYGVFTLRVDRYALIPRLSADERARRVDRHGFGDDERFVDRNRRVRRVRQIEGDRLTRRVDVRVELAFVVRKVF